ncbi:MAG: helix-turn-helix domain-containing protein [Succinivibrionaceae bacterium]|nr:helix-turn-helix domain-containing protein [Succinivibrionaceae bacterium]
MAKKLLLTPRDVMNILGITKDRYYKIIKQNLIPYITLWDAPKNPRKYFRQQDIIEFIKKRTELSDEEIRQRYLCRY